MIALDPLKPYKWLFVAGLLLVLISASFLKGCSVGKGIGKRENASLIVKKDQALAKASGQLKDAERSLRAAGAALDAQNQANQARIAAAEQAEKEAQAAGEVAALELKKAQKRIADLDKKYEHARRNPDCDALLNTDLQKVCGL